MMMMMMTMMMIMIIATSIIETCDGRTMTMTIDIDVCNDDQQISLVLCLIEVN